MDRMRRRAGGRRGLGTCERGVALLEFALVAPLFLLLLLGVVAYGLFFATQIAVVTAASEGARASIPGLSSGERNILATRAAQAVIQGYAPLLKPSSATVTAGDATGGTGLFQVTVAYAAPFAAPLVPMPGSPSYTATVSNGGY